MRTLLRWIARIVVVLLVLIVGLWAFGPREPVDLAAKFSADGIGSDPDQYLAEREAQFDDITPGGEKRIIWSDEPGQRTSQVIVYLHGFSATSEEIRPVPDEVATKLGANLYFARLKGHARSGDALATATVADWARDYDEALAVAAAIGDEIIILSTSTGATLAAAMLAEGRGDNVKGVAMISPNFRVANPAAAVLTFPAARTWVPALFGADRSFEPMNEGHAKWWTTAYPSTALFPMAAIVKHAFEADYASVGTPALFLFADSDQVVDHRATREVASKWGGEVTIETVVPGAGDDPLHHVISGDILSPGMNDKTVDILLNWIEGL